MTELMNEDNLGRKEEFVDQILENAMKQIHLIETKREGIWILNEISRSKFK